jgi:hypothetical protein
MAILGDIFKKSIALGNKLSKIKKKTPYEQQKATLKKLLKKAKNTQFGIHYRFEDILDYFTVGHKPKRFYQEYKNNVPLHNYNTIFKEWWHKELEGEKDVTWPGKVKYFALSSGTSESSSKHIPITKDMLKAIRKTGTRQLLALKNFDIPPEIYTKGVLMLGGSTDLHKQKDYFEGDLSGIMTSKLPFWFQYFYKPGKKIASTRDWQVKLDKMTKKAPEWDMGYVAGVPAWMTILFEKIIAEYKLNNIHEIWPNLSVFCHGGVAFEPYKQSFEKLLGRPITYIETYLASEGFLAFQEKPDKGMQLVLDNGIFFEFIPFNEKNFDEDGEVKPNAEAVMIDGVEEGKEYAVVISTVAGAWRYLIGDTIKFINKKDYEIIITGRTKHYISMCGEHLSVDNMNHAIEKVGKELNLEIKEFSVAGVPYGNLFAHQWYVGCDKEVDKSLFKTKLDEYLKEVNDDYKTERLEAIKEIYVDILPNSVFYEWLKLHGKEGGSHKFPRVLKKDKLANWKQFLASKGFISEKV